MFTWAVLTCMCKQACFRPACFFVFFFVYTTCLCPACFYPAIIVLNKVVENENVAISKMCLIIIASAAMRI